MKLFLKFILHILANALGLYLSARYVPGFHFSGDIVQFLLLALILTILNFALKPFLKIVFSPLIILTLGLGLLLVNALILYLLDFFSANLTITGVSALFFSSIVVSVVNFIFHFFL